MNLSNPASSHDLLRSDEQQIEMSANMFRCIVEVRFYLMRIKLSTDVQAIKTQCDDTERFLYQFQIGELENLRDLVKITDERKEGGKLNVPTITQELTEAKSDGW